MQRKKVAEAIINFMYYKQYLLRDIGEYFGEKDAEDIRKFSGQTLWYAWSTIKLTLEKKIRQSDAAICPFCLALDAIGGPCDKCPYAKRHLLCGNPESSYFKITDKLWTEQDKDSIFYLFGQKEIRESLEILNEAVD